MTTDENAIDDGVGYMGYEYDNNSNLSNIFNRSFETVYSSSKKRVIGGLSGTDDLIVVPIDFDFGMYGQQFETAYVRENGVVYFDDRIN